MKKAGRREAGEDTRSILLRAVADLTSERGIAPISVRDITRQADVNQAMIRYHFGDKDGLMQATLDHGFEQLFAQVPTGQSFEKTINALVEWLWTHGWLIILMMQFVYSGDTMRAHFETTHAPRLAGIYAGALEQGRKAGTVRADLDDGFAMTALISLLVFPLIAKPILARAVQGASGAAAPKDTAAQILKLFSPKGDDT